MSVCFGAATAQFPLCVSQHSKPCSNAAAFVGAEAVFTGLNTPGGTPGRPGVLQTLGGCGAAVAVRPAGLPAFPRSYLAGCLRVCPA